MATGLRAAVFFDRDGTLNRDVGYTHRVADLEWMPEAREAVAFANRAGFLVFVVTNQSGVARGLYGEDAIRDFHAAMQASLAEAGARIDAFAWCPHHPQASVAAYRRECRCRKPAPGMILDLVSAWHVDSARSLMIGDAETDMAAARAAGIRGIRYTGDSLLSRVRSAVVSPKAGTM